jgi:uncharacterized RDD family membrane protein YckC
LEEKVLDNLEREKLVLTSISKRSIAFFIDDLIVSLLVFIIFYDSISVAKSIEEIIFLVNSAFGYIVAIKILYHTFFVWQYGATMGKMLFKMQVVDEKSFLKPDFLHSLIRAVVRVVSEGLFYLGFVWGLFTKTRQTWHDKLAKTLVIDV